MADRGAVEEEEFVANLNETLFYWLAYHLPRRVVYWVIVRAGAKATTVDYRSRTPDEVGILDLMRAWE